MRASGAWTADPMRKRILNLRDFKQQLTKANLPAWVARSVQRDGFCFIESDGSAHVLGGLLSELSRFFSSADHQEKGYLKAYRHGILRGYFPPVRDPASRTLRAAKGALRIRQSQQSVSRQSSAPETRLRHPFRENHVKAIADIVLQSRQRLCRGDVSLLGGQFPPVLFESIHTRANSSRAFSVTRCITPLSKTPTSSSIRTRR